MFGRESITTDVVYSQDIQQLEPRNHMSGLSIDKLTTEGKEVIQEFNKRKTALLGKYNTQIKDLDTTHETWIGTFSAQYKKGLQKCQELYTTKQQKIDKIVYSTVEVQAYAIYKQALDTYKNTKDKATEKYTKDLQLLNSELDKIAIEINQKIQQRETEAEETRREEEIQQYKQEIKGIVYDIRKVEKAIEREDKFINKPEILALDKALARRYQHKLARHRRILGNRLQRRKDIFKGKGLSLDIAPDEELSDGGYSSVEEFKDKETLPQNYRIKKNRFREPYPSLFEYPHQIPTHHAADNLTVEEQWELEKRIESKAKQEKEKKSKVKGKVNKKTDKVEQSVEVDDIPLDTPPKILAMPRGNRGNRNDDDSDDEEHGQRNHYWSLRDIPKFEGKGEQPFSHLMEFEDCLVASGMRIEPDEENPMVQPDYRDIINKFKASLKNNARVWYSMYIEKRVPQLHTAEGWKTVKSKFLTYFNPIGSTKEQQIEAWKELKWKPEEEKLSLCLGLVN